MDTKKLDEAVDSFILFTRSLPRQALEASRTGRWGTREVLIHLVFWHEQYAGIAAAVAANKSPELLAGTLKELNHKAVEREASTAIEELFARWIAANRRFARTASRPDAYRLKIPLSRQTKAWPLADLIRLAAGHIEKHQKNLRKALH